MKALILAGGFGTRLRPLSCTRPKILFPVVNRPLLQWTFERLANNNVKEVILAVNYQTEFFLRQAKIPKYRMKIIYSRDLPTRPLGTGGPIKKAERLIGSESFLAINGDVFADVNYKEIVMLHEEKKAVATIALCKVEEPSRFGVAELTNENRIKKFVEKPPKENAPSNLINAGVYVLSPEIFDYIPQGRKVSLEREVFTKLAEKHELYGYISKGIWTDIGETEDYLRINRLVLDTFFKEKKYKVRKGTRIENPVVIDDGVSIGEKSVLGPYVVLGRNVDVGKNVRIRGSIVFRGTVISDLSSVDGAIIGENGVIGKKVKIREGCVIGDRAIIRDNVSLAKGVSVCPAKEVSESVLTSKCII